MPRGDGQCRDQSCMTNMSCVVVRRVYVVGKRARSDTICSVDCFVFCVTCAASALGDGRGQAASEEKGGDDSRRCRQESKSG